MLSINIKEFFFDRDKVKAAVDKATRDNLSKGAAYIRRTARESIKDRSTGRSAPGQPPYSHVGAKRKKLNRARKAAGLDPVKGGFQGVKHILFGFDPSRPFGDHRPGQQSQGYGYARAGVRRLGAGEAVPQGSCGHNHDLHRAEAVHGTGAPQRSPQPPEGLGGQREGIIKMSPANLVFAPPGRD